MNYGKWLVQGQQMTLSRHRGIAERNLYFLHSLPLQGSVNDNNAELNHKKSHRRVGWVWSVSCRYLIPKQATLNHWEMNPRRSAKWHVSQELLWLLDLGLSVSVKTTLERSSNCQQAHFFSYSSRCILYQGPRNTTQLKSNVRGHEASELRSAHQNSAKRSTEVTSHPGTKKQGWLPLAHNWGHCAMWAA